ncbi:MAG: M23 family metallopeptidase [Candidatus Eremiobacteraeota bacterium]|nr:M23 family metallopeptidase [Candidatus Eremiobacteraeota bacterium]
MYRFLLLLWLLLLVSASADLLPDQVRVDKQERDGVHALVLHNRCSVPVTYRFDFTTLENARVEAPSHLTYVVPARGSIRGPVIKRSDDRYRWQWNYRSYYHFGDWTKVTADRPYELPFSRGKAYEVSQGFNGELSHHGTEAYAVDFNLPEGTPVTAARKGLVVRVEEGFSQGGWDRSLKESANTVVIAHQDGTLSRYVHLLKDSVVVDPGDWVETGTLLGRSGNTGYTTGPHLHFDVYSPGPDMKVRTLDFRLWVDGREVLPLEGQVYLHE